MSDVYLDTELTADDYLYIARELASSALSGDELEAVFFTEVHPVLCWNLTAVAGHWGDFGKQWVTEQIEQHLSAATTNPGWLARLRRTQRNRSAEALKKSVRCDWEKIRLLVEVIRKQAMASRS